MRINVTFTDKEIVFENVNTGRSHTLRNNEHPEIFEHPRHLIAKVGQGEELIRQALRKTYGFSLSALKVFIDIRREPLGGLTDADFYIIGNIFVYAGAYKVSFKQLPGWIINLTGFHSSRS